MKRRKHTQRDAIKNYFPLPNEIFMLGLSAGEIAVYAYLLFCENRRTYTCYPSYNTIGKAVNMSKNTVRKHVASLEEKHLIRTSRTSVFTKEGLKRNGNLQYTICPMQEVLDLQYARQFVQMDLQQAKQRAAKQLAVAERKRGCARVCEPLAEETANNPPAEKDADLAAISGALAEGESNKLAASVEAG